jgi:hypothetical protein
MIGGTDIIFPTVGDAASLDLCIRIIQRDWPMARFEDTLTGEKYGSSAEIPLDRTRELFVYHDAQAEAAWDADSEDSPLNSLIYLILNDQHITVVVDDPSGPEVGALLLSLRESLTHHGASNGNPVLISEAIYP